jgi:hypothetical protein
MRKKEIPFFGPEVSIRTTCGNPGDPSFFEEELDLTRPLGIVGHIRARRDAWIPALGDPNGAINICAEHDFFLHLPRDGQLLISFMMTL